MDGLYNCLDCRKVALLIGADEKKCPSCSGTNGKLLSKERVVEGMKG